MMPLPPSRKPPKPLDLQAGGLKPVVAGTGTGPGANRLGVQPGPMGGGPAGPRMPAPGAPIDISSIPAGHGARRRAMEANAAGAAPPALGRAIPIPGRRPLMRPGGPGPLPGPAPQMGARPMPQGPMGPGPGMPSEFDIMARKRRQEYTGRADGQRAALEEM